MYVYQRHALGLMLMIAALLVGLPASAWVETSIRAHLATVDVERSGQAIITHQLLMQIRGGPLEGFELMGVDADAEPLPDAVASPATSGSGGDAAIPLLLEKKETSFAIVVDRKNGLKRGVYLFKFSYRTDLLGRRLLRREGRGVLLNWTGPRLADGVDSAKALFRLPKAAEPPRLVEPGLEESAVGLEDDASGVFVSSLRRGADKDELEVIRLHVSKDEAVDWRILASGEALNGFGSPPKPPPAEPEPNAPFRLPWLLFSVMAALVYALLVWLKHRLCARACQTSRANVRVLVPIPVLLRAPLSGLLLGAAVLVAAATDWPIAAGALLLLSMTLAAHLSPEPPVRLRGPGEWRRLDDERAFQKNVAKSPGRWLDSGSLAGFSLFVLGLAGFGALGLKLLPTSTYHAMLAALGSAALLPLFCTGRASELPADLVTGPRPLLKWLAVKLEKAGYEAMPMGRFPVGANEPDELRLHVLPKRAVSGLASLEVGLEYQQGGGGPIALPCVLVRVKDRSAAYYALERSVVWLRGRSSDERVAVVRPMLPTRGQCLSLVRRLAQLLTVRQRPVPARSLRSTVTSLV